MSKFNEEQFIDTLKTVYGLTDGSDFVREHGFKRYFRDQSGSQFRIRVDVWCPRHRIAIEFKCAPLGCKVTDYNLARSTERSRREAYHSNRDILKVSWSNQREKFRLVTEQANDDPETEGILWILVDDRQFSDEKTYTHYRTPQVKWLRSNTAWNPMRVTEAGRLLYMFKEVENLTIEQVFGIESPGEASEDARKWFENYKRTLLADLHTLDTTEGIYLITGYGSKVVKDADGDLYTLEELEATRMIRPPVTGRQALGRGL